MTGILLLGVFLTGLAVGSFINVLIYRTLHGMSPYKGRSVCDHCNRQLGWFENLPLVSYLVLGGRCRTCRKRIDWSYPLVEGVTGVLFVWWASLGFAFFRLSLAPLTYFQPLFWLFVGLMLVVIFFTDLLYGIIPDFSLVGLGVATLIYRGVLVNTGVMQAADFGESVIVGVVAFALFLALFLGTRGRGIGFGDVKFSLVMGFLLGFPKSLVGFFLSFVIGGVVAMVMLISRRKKIGQTVPFGPFMVVGLVAALVWGERLWGWYWGGLG